MCIFADFPAGIPAIMKNHIRRKSCKNDSASIPITCGQKAGTTRQNLHLRRRAISGGSIYCKIIPSLALTRDKASRSTLRLYAYHIRSLCREVRMQTPKRRNRSVPGSSLCSHPKGQARLQLCTPSVTHTTYVLHVLMHNTMEMR